MSNYEYLYDKKIYNELINLDYYSNKEMEVKIEENAYVLPFKDLDGKLGGGIVNSSGIYLEESSLHYGAGSKYDFDEENVKKVNETVVYVGAFCTTWGHCITDNIRRLWFFKSNVYSKYKKCRIIYIPLKGFSFYQNFLELLEILEIPYEKFEPINDIMMFDEIVIPSECFFSDKHGRRFFTQEYRYMINSIREYAFRNFVEKPEYVKVYFSHAQHYNINQVGEKKLERFFVNEGYRVIYPENYSFVEQLNIMANCKEFASTVGSCSHNIMFLRDKSKAILIPRAHYLTGYQLAIDMINDISVTYVDSSLSIFTLESEPWLGPIYYYISDNLMECYNVSEEKRKKYWKTNLKDWKAYRLIGLSKKRIFERGAPEVFYKELYKSIYKYESCFRFNIIRKKLRALIGMLLSRRG